MYIYKTGLEGGFKAGEIEVRVIGFNPATNQVRLAVDAPREIKIERFKGSRFENVSKRVANSLH